MNKNWRKYTDWLRYRLPQYYQLLNEPATLSEIEEFEAELDISLPADVKELYLTNNGEKARVNNQVVSGVFLGFEFLRLNSIVAAAEQWSGISLDNYHGSSFPEGAIKIAYTNPKWIPLFHDYGGNYIGLDFDPDSKGRYGQIINFGSDESDKFVIAESLTLFLEFVIERIESGQCDRAIIEEEDGGISYGLQPQSHLIDDLKEVFGKK